jgi:hypothetical protein
MKLVKLYPYNKQFGWVLRSYTLTNGKNPIRFRGTTGSIKSGWYEVEDDFAEELSKVLQQDRYPEGPKAFMVANDREHSADLDRKIAERLAGKNEKEGNAEAPIRIHRPGLKTEAKNPTKPKTRKRQAE